MIRQAAERRGRLGEIAAAWWLRLHGWRILARRVRTPVGEVDLIARRGRVTAFVEVKTRATERNLDHVIDAWRLRRVAAAANLLAARYAPSGDLRIDVLLVSPRRFPRHIENAWTG